MLTLYVFAVHFAAHISCLHCMYFAAYAKESNYFYAIPLRHFYSEKIVLDSKSSLGAYQISCTKGCTLFCTAPLSGQFLRVAVACKTKVYMLAWKHPSLSSSTGGVPLAPQAPANPADSFIKHRVRPCRFGVFIT